MSGKVTFGPDCSSYQGDVDWLKVSAVCGFGSEKVTEGTGYLNPRWLSAKAALRARAKYGFVPMAYFFLDAATDGAAQARYFAHEAGDLAGFGIVIDFERAPNGNPTIAEGRSAVHELRTLYPHHPVGGYAPHWFTGGEDLRFFDWLWASSYVLGTGDPGMLYRRVPASFWAPYGSRSPLLLQFTSQSTVAGIRGLVDCSAFHGDRAQLASAVLPRAPKPPAPPVPKAHHGDDGMYLNLRPGEPPVVFAAWADAAAYHEPVQASYASLRLAGEAGAAVKVTLYHADSAPETFTPGLSDGVPFTVVPARGWHAVRTVALQRLDSKAALGASAVFRLW